MNENDIETQKKDDTLSLLSTIETVVKEVGATPSESDGLESADVRQAVMMASARGDVAADNSGAVAAIMATERIEPVVAAAKKEVSARKKTALDEFIDYFMDVYGRDAALTYAIKKNLKPQLRPLLVSVLADAIRNKMTTGTWIQKLSDGALVKKSESDPTKYESAPELEKEIEAPITMVSNGPGRHEIIHRVSSYGK